MYYEIVSVSKDGYEKSIKAMDGFMEAFFEALALRAISTCAVIGFDRDDERIFKFEFF